MNKINFKVAIIEDYKDDSDHLNNLLKKYQEDNKDIFIQVDTFIDASIFMDKYNFQYDLLLFLMYHYLTTNNSKYLAGLSRIIKESYNSNN